jgi:AraC-like DNA-binding protein
MCQIFAGETQDTSDEEFVRHFRLLRASFPRTNSQIEVLVERALLVEMALRRLGNRDLRLFRQSLVACEILPRQQCLSLTSQAHQTRAAALRALLDGEFHKPLTLIGLSRRLHEHRNVLARSFMRTYGLSCRRYLIRRRVSQAAELLRTTAFKVDAIAGMVGYRSKKSFYVEFEREIGMTPAAFRGQASRTPLDPH